MVLLLLTGCLGTLSTSDGTEPVRAALWFEDPPIQPGVVPAGGLALVLNSPLHCEPEDVEDDPDTPEDEAAAALVYWQGEIYSAFAREDAFVVVLSLYSRGEGLDGTYTLSQEAYADPAGALAEHAHTGFGAWLHVEEASVDDLDGLFYVYEPERISYDLAVHAPASAELETTADGVQGSFSFDLDDISGSFRAETCDNVSLLYAIWGIYQAFPGLEEE